MVCAKQVMMLSMCEIMRCKLRQTMRFFSSS